MTAAEYNPDLPCLQKAHCGIMCRMRMVEVGRKACLPLAAAAVVMAAGPADACTAIIVGRKASASGRVVVAHNNDGVGPFTMQYALLPARGGAQAA